MEKKKLLFLVAEDWYFWSHRKDLAKEAQKKGYQVVVATRAGTYTRQIKDLDFSLIPLEINRRGLNPLKELATILQITRIYRREKPDIVHHVALKPVLYGSISAYLSGTRYVINAVTGLGYLSVSTGKKAYLIRFFVNAFLRFLFHQKNSRLILQNQDDYSFFIKKRIASKDKTHLIRGSGVDTLLFSPADRSNQFPVVTLASRMLWHKGVGEFVEAARILKRNGIKADFVLAGDTDTQNPAEISQLQLKSWHKEGIIRWLGHQDDVATLLANSDIACLPSYREGLPKFLLEAASCALPIVAADVPGCREIVRHQENGLLVPAKDAVRLAEAIKYLIENPDLSRKMGACGREIVIKQFSIKKIISETLSLYDPLSKNETGLRRPRRSP